MDLGIGDLGPVPALENKSNPEVPEVIENEEIDMDDALHDHLGMQVRFVSFHKDTQTFNDRVLTSKMHDGFFRLLKSSDQKRVSNKWGALFQATSPNTNACMYG